MIKITANKKLYFFRKYLDIIVISALLILINSLLKLEPVNVLSILISIIFLKKLYPDLKNKPYKLLNLGLIFICFFVVSYFIIIKYNSVQFLPFCVIPMLTMLLFDESIIALLLTLTCAISVAILNGNDFYTVVIFLISGISAIMLSKGIRRRIEVIRTGAIIGLIQVITLFFINSFKFTNPLDYFIFFANGILCGVVVMWMHALLEHPFKVATDVTLLELADFNHPLLQRMIMEAPGTYHHSLIVGNLSDAACKAIGAHALLARIGAYYHDIGKLQKPEYFSENQNLNESKHDNLTPTISKMVIMNHVKEGAELAKKFKLSPSIIDFIEQHHGTSLVYYFYRRALEGKDEHQKVEEEGFRYPGPKPKSKETAVVLLADSVEASMRTLRDPSSAKIEELVHKIINNKFIDGQLDACELTLNDLEIIAKVFIRILSGIYHNRTAYPQQEAKK